MITDREFIEAAFAVLRDASATVAQLTWHLRYGKRLPVDATRLHRLLNLAASWG